MVSDAAPPATTSLQLRPYQQEDVAHLQDILSRHRAAYLFHDMRVGKLIEFIAYCRYERPTAVLIVAPLSTLLNVQEEFRRWLGWHIFVRPKESDQVEYPDWAPRDNPYIVAVNKEVLRDPRWWGFGVRWELVFLDEAHWFRSHRAQQTKGATKLKTDKLILATGTPIMNGLPREVYPLLKLADPKAWTSYWGFLQKYAASKPSSYGSGPVDENAPWRRGMRDTLKTYMAPQVLRREYPGGKQEPKTLRINLGDFDPEHLKAYEDLERDWLVTLDDVTVEVPTKLALTTRLRQLLATPRALDIPRDGAMIAALLDYLDGKDHPLIVWCWHKNVVKAVAVALGGAGRKVTLVTGDTAPAARALCVRLFQEGRYDTIVCNWALSEGITIDRAKESIFLERSWLPAQNDQAAMRSPESAVTILSSVEQERFEKTLRRKATENAAFMDFSHGSS